MKYDSLLQVPLIALEMEGPVECNTLWDTVQGSHASWKTLKNNEQFSSPGKHMENERKNQMSWKILSLFGSLSFVVRY